MDTRISRTLVVAALVGWTACQAGGAKGKKTSLAALQGKTLDLGVAWERTLPSDSTRVGRASLGLSFADVGKWEGNACPIVQASATFGGVTLKPTSQGGAMQCGVNDDPACGQECLSAAWYAGNITALLETLPQTVDVVLKDGSETAVATVRNPAPMATVTVLDLVEGQQVHYGDSFHVQLQPQLPATIEDIQAGFFVHMFEYGGDLPLSLDVASGTNVWRVDIVPQQLSAGPLTLQFWFSNPSLLFDSCPSDFACSGSSEVEFSKFVLQYAP